MDKKVEDLKKKLENLLLKKEQLEEEKAKSYESFDNFVLKLGGNPYYTTDINWPNKEVLEYVLRRIDEIKIELVDVEAEAGIIEGEKVKGNEKRLEAIRRGAEIASEIWKYMKDNNFDKSEVKRLKVQTYVEASFKKRGIIITERQFRKAWASIPAEFKIKGNPTKIKNL